MRCSVRRLFLSILPLSLFAACAAQAPGADGESLTIVDIGPAEVPGARLDLQEELTLYRLVGLQGVDLRGATVITEDESIDLGTYLELYPDGLAALDGELMLGSVAAQRRYRQRAESDVGSASGALAVAQQQGGGGSDRGGFVCNPFFCVCKGTDECGDMWTSGVCGGAGYCDDTSYPETCICTRFLRASPAVLQPATELSTLP